MAAEGTRSPNLREWQSSLVTNYTFREGRLTGIGVGGYYKWSSPDTIGYRVGANGGLDNKQPYHGKSTSDVGLTLSYTRKLLKTHTWKVQLNLRNLLDNHDPLPTRADQASRTDVQPVYRIYRLQAPRTWVLTNTLTF